MKIIDQPNKFNKAKNNIERYCTELERNLLQRMKTSHEKKEIQKMKV